MKKINYFKNIIIAVDRSDASKKASKKAFYLAKITDINIIVIHVVNIQRYALPSTQSSYVEGIVKNMIKNGEKILDQTIKMGSEMGLKVKKKLVEGSPDDEIIKNANKDDLIFMGDRGHFTIDRILIGSVSEKVLHHSNSTVMIVR
jgi:nucleotide-binding universal stress UspA family protein